MSVHDRDKTGKTRIRCSAVRESGSCSNRRIIYLRDIVAKWPQSKVVPDVLAKLVSTYRTLGYVEDVQEVCGYFRANWPGTPQLKSSCPQPSTPGTPTGP